MRVHRIRQSARACHERAKTRASFDSIFGKGALGLLGVVSGRGEKECALQPPITKSMIYCSHGLTRGARSEHTTSHPTINPKVLSTEDQRGVGVKNEK